MKDLTIEEKAKRYDEITEKFDVILNLDVVKESGTVPVDDVRKIIPELKESDGWIPKEIIKYLEEKGDFRSCWIAWLEKQKTSEEALQYLKENHSPSEVSDFQAAMNIAVAKAYDKGVKDGLENKSQTFTKKEVDDAYLAGVRDTKQELEKQGEQKPAWSEEDEKIIQDIINDIAIVQEQVYCKSRCEDEINWLKSLKDRVQPKQEWSDEEVEIIDWLVASFDCLRIPTDTFYQSKVRPFLISLRNKIQPIIKEWSEEDECCMAECINAIATKDGWSFEEKRKTKHWLKSLKDRYIWKPSEKQMRALKEACDEHWEPDGLDHLYTLYQDLKKLSEE